MNRMLADYRVFWREFRGSYRTTGAIMPSGRLLARALSRPLAEHTDPCRVLEVGPGTGAVTASIVRSLKPDDRFDLVELNDQFVARLRERFASEPPFTAVADQCRVLHQRVEQLPERNCYDLIISGLPLNNFSVADVEQILETLMGLLKPGGTLSFFEYIAIRRAKALVSGAAERERLRGIAALLERLLGPHQIARDCILPNFPPAFVHHVRRPTH
jgi:phospholipid N-methyltransferase